MKAAVIQSPGILAVEEVPEPIIGAYDALCATVAAAICAGTDSHIVDNDPYHQVTFPTILGHEGIGRVLSVGPKVGNLAQGMLVTRVMNKLPEGSRYSLRYGAFADKTVVTDWQAMRDDGLPEEEWRPYSMQRPLPAGIDPVAATMIITWRETFSFFSRMEPQARESILIIGSGANALSFVEHARNRSLSVAVVGSPGRASAFADAGAHVVPYSAPNVSEQLAKSGFRTFDLVIDAVGNSATTNAVLERLRPGGRLGVYGLNEFHSYSINPNRAQGDFSFFDGKIYDEGGAHEAVIAHLLAGELDHRRYLSESHYYPLARIADALAATRERKVFKSVIVW